MNNNNIEKLAPFLFERAKHIQNGGEINSEEAETLFIKTDLLIAHYRVKRDKIECKMYEELEVIDKQIEMADSFRKTFFHCTKR